MVNVVWVVRKGGGVDCSSDSLEEKKNSDSGSSVGERRTPGRARLGSHLSQTSVEGDSLGLVMPGQQ